MTQDERRAYLIRELLAESDEYRDIMLPKDGRGQKDLLRSLMNLRAPKPAGEEFLKVQDEYLCAERDREGVVDVDLLPEGRERVVLWQGDITTLKADAIVNAANGGMRGCFYPLHSCIDNMVHSKSGVQLRLYCDKIMNEQGGEEPAGRAKITPAFNLPCSYIIHTVGPVIYGRVTEEDCRLLASCYRSCLELAAQKGLKSIVFCCISTGEFRFPNRRAAQIAVDTSLEFLDSDRRIRRVVFDVFKDVDYQIYKELLGV